MKTQYYTATSLDGFIATEDDSLEWLFPLADLIGAEFTIGAVRLRGLRPCPPCLYLAQLLKVPELVRGLAHSGGIYAEILNEGILGVGDAIVPMQSDSDSCDQPATP